MEIREAVTDDLPFLWDCLALAAQEPSAEAAAAVPEVEKCIPGFPRPGDFRAVAKADGQPGGAGAGRRGRGGTGAADRAVAARGRGARGRAPNRIASVMKHFPDEIGIARGGRPIRRDPPPRW